MKHDDLLAAFHRLCGFLSVRPCASVLFGCLAVELAVCGHFSPAIRRSFIYVYMCVYMCASRPHGHRPLRSLLAVRVDTRIHTYSTKNRMLWTLAEILANYRSTVVIEGKLQSVRRNSETCILVFIQTGQEFLGILAPQERR
jgi:hypothetical protein